MVFEPLTKGEKEIIYSCLNAAVAYLTDSESLLIIGKDHATIKKVMDNFPFLRDSMTGDQREITRLISDCLGHFSLRYMPKDRWSRLFQVSQLEVKELASKWDLLNGESDNN